MDRGAWRATVNRVAKSWTRLKRLSMHASVNPTPNLSLPSRFLLVTIKFAFYVYESISVLYLSSFVSYFFFRFYI